MDKKEARKRGRAVRSAVVQREAQEQRVLKRLMCHPQIAECQHIASYVSFGSELSTVAINQWILEGKTLYLPRVEGDTMTFYQVTDLECQLEEGSFGIMAPMATCPKMEQIDAVLVPGLAFTPEGGRLGYGGGYYDKFLAEYRPYKLALCFSEQIVEEIPIEEFDVKMDEILSGEAY